MNPPGLDGGFESIEIEGVPNHSLATYSLLVIDGNPANAGTVLNVIPLQPAGNIGSNGLLLVRTSTATVVPSINAGTNALTAAISPNLSNGSVTLALGTGAAPVVGTTLTAPLAGFTVVDAVAYKLNSAHSEYASALAGSQGTNLGTKANGIGSLYRTINTAGAPGGWAGGPLNLSFANPGPYRWSVTSGHFFGPSGWTATGPVVGPDPGTPNYRTRTVSGTLNFPDNYVGTIEATPSFSFQVFAPAGTLRQSVSVAVNPLVGTFSFALDPAIRNDQIDLLVKGPTWLAKRIAAITLAGSLGSITGTLYNGDCDGDNAITVFDYDLISSAFDTSPGQTGWDARADLDKDGTVTVFDYDIASANFDVEGDH